jgi:hypothetical protein
MAVGKYRLICSIGGSIGGVGFTEVSCTVRLVVLMAADETQADLFPSLCWKQLEKLPTMMRLE